ncbi:unnamed protein product, partial [Symbiodinium pilosum]
SWRGQPSGGGRPQRPGMCRLMTFLRNHKMARMRPKRRREKRRTTARQTRT